MGEMSQHQTVGIGGWPEIGLPALKQSAPTVQRYNDMSNVSYTWGTVNYMMITVANRSGPKQANAYDTMRRLILLIAAFVKRLYVLTNIYLRHQLYATVSSIPYTREDLYIGTRH